MTYTLYHLICDAISWLTKHPKVITMPLAPITRGKVKSGYNAENAPASFDPDLLQQIRVMDASYISYTDSDLQALVDETVPIDQDITAQIGDNQGGS